ncbi:Bud-site selection protein [Phakopsora pachyrhizi]|uniref:Bud-site selection protein n=1 Tax=Phakopsora pachyrhizi TaxID=170000 RepID=A0AAV0BKI2_PHAPC|nr:Bud-site selection protein [Phakopsora pachyrhizi]
MIDDEKRSNREKEMIRPADKEETSGDYNSDTEGDDNDYLDGVSNTDEEEEEDDEEEGIKDRRKTAELIDLRRGSNSLESNPTKKSSIPLRTDRMIKDQSTFLPRLNVGYYIDLKNSTDDRRTKKPKELKKLIDSIEKDEIEFKKIENEKFRKNRRGQRARRMIWEKKYGKDAKHLKELRQKRFDKRRSDSHEGSTSNDRSNMRNDSYKTRVNFNNRSELRIEKAFRGDKNRSDNFKTGSNGITIDSNNSKSFCSSKNLDVNDSRSLSSHQKRPNDEDGDHQKAIHPSWKAKQDQLRVISDFKPVGKKIKFS